MLCLEAQAQEQQGFPTSAEHPGGALADNPLFTAHLIAASSPGLVGSVEDVNVVFGPNVNKKVVTDTLLDVIKDALRAAGQPVGIMSSTLRTPAAQAKAMYDNCVANVAKQLTLYGNPGQQVIQVYIDITAQGESPSIIIQAMEDNIIELGPQIVSNHCSGSPTAQVIDVAYSSFNAQKRPLFIAHLRARSYNVLDEP